MFSKENERIHQAYVNGEFDAPAENAQEEQTAGEETEEESASGQPETEEKEEDNALSEEDGENEGGENG